MSALREKFEAEWAAPRLASIHRHKVAGHDLNGSYISCVTQAAWEGYQAATEAAKATGTAGKPELPLPKYLGDDLCGLQTFGYTADQMRAYGQQCAEAARQPAPVVAVKPWEARMQEYFAQGSVKMRTPASFMADEIIDWRAALAATAAPVAEIEPCGGCGNSDPDKRCIGCTHPFGQVTPECTFSEDEIYDIERCLRTGVTMGYTKKKGAEKALAIFKTATNRSQP